MQSCVNTRLAELSTAGVDRIIDCYATMQLWADSVLVGLPVHHHKHFHAAWNCLKWYAIIISHYLSGRVTIQKSIIWINSITMKTSNFVKSNWLIHSMSVLWQFQSLFQSQFSTECDLVLSNSISSIPSFSYGHEVAAYVIVLIFLSHPSLFLSSITCFRRQFQCKMWPIQLAFL
jgi:hypothetical protein